MSEAGWCHVWGPIQHPVWYAITLNWSFENNTASPYKGGEKNLFLTLHDVREKKLEVKLRARSSHLAGTERSPNCLHQHKATKIIPNILLAAKWKWCIFLSNQIKQLGNNIVWIPLSLPPLPCEIKDLIHIILSLRLTDKPTRPTGCAAASWPVTPLLYISAEKSSSSLSQRVFKIPFTQLYRGEYKHRHCYLESLGILYKTTWINGVTSW